MTAIVIDHIVADKVIEHWASPDLLGMMQPFGRDPCTGAELRLSVQRSLFRTNVGVEPINLPLYLCKAKCGLTRRSSRPLRAWCFIMANSAIERRILSGLVL